MREQVLQEDVLHEDMSYRRTYLMGGLHDDVLQDVLPKDIN